MILSIVLILGLTYEPIIKSKQSRKALAGGPSQQSEVINTKFASLQNEIWREILSKVCIKQSYSNL